jgi:hypothetical protein
MNGYGSHKREPHTIALFGLAAGREATRMRLLYDWYGEEEGYQNFCRDLPGFLQRAGKDLFIWAGMGIYGQMRTEQIDSALQWGTLPVIGIKDMPRSGVYYDGAPGFWINRKHVLDYEEGRRYPVLSERNTVVPFIFMVVLHETVHWADYRHDGRHQFRYNELGQCVGDVWEIHAFGADLAWNPRTNRVERQ